MNFRVLLASLLLITSCVWGETPVTSEQLYQQAYDNFVKHDYNGASASLDKINPVDQKKADVLNLRGAIYKRLGELDNAANAYNDALKINPKDWVPKYNLAEVNFLREEYKASRTFLEQALASMPESDRLQKQDLILYKVYLTYLLQGDDDKAKLLLDSFDVNSANPVYYFAQAAWSYKKKDTAKAKTWVDSTEGLYSADLRNSYSQALVDIGWLEPAAGAGAVTIAASSASATPEMVGSSPTPATQEVVPLASSSASPLAVNNAVAPNPTSSPTASPAPSIPTNVAAVVPTTPEKQKGAGWKTLLGILVVLAVAAIALINLARRSRIVPEPVDNTGYAAIAASGDPEAANLGSHHSEGTGAVIVQQDESPVPAPIKITPIHREYEDDGVPAASAATLVTATAIAASSRKKGSTKNTGKSVSTPAAVKPTAKVATRKSPASTPAPNPSSTTKKATVKNAASVTKSADGSRPIRLVPVPTINVPPPDESQRKRIVVSEIEKIVIKKASSSKKAASTPVVASETAPISATTQPIAKVTPVSKKKSAPARPATQTPSKPKIDKPAPAPVITIPEFEEIPENQPTRTVIRLTPEENIVTPDEEKPQGT